MHAQINGTKDWDTNYFLCFLHIQMIVIDKHIYRYMYYVNAFSYTSNLCTFSIDVAHMCELIQENVHEHVCKATFKWLNDTF